MDDAPELEALVERLRERYTADPVPPCRVCGEPLSMQSAGGGEPTVWGCSPLESDPENPGMLRMKAGRDLRGDDHYSKSRWTQYRTGDSDVLDLIESLVSTLSRVRREAIEEAAGVEVAAKALLDACYLADAHEELSEYVDGSLLDALSEALGQRRSLPPLGIGGGE